jgi:hypothetical protein
MNKTKRGFSDSDFCMVLAVLTAVSIMSAVIYGMLKETKETKATPQGEGEHVATIPFNYKVYKIVVDGQTYLITDNGNAIIKHEAK